MTEKEKPGAEVSIGQGVRVHLTTPGSVSVSIELKMTAPEARALAAALIDYAWGSESGGRGDL